MCLILYCVSIMTLGNKVIHISINNNNLLYSLHTCTVHVNNSVYCVSIMILYKKVKKLFLITDTVFGFLHVHVHVGTHCQNLIDLPLLAPTFKVITHVCIQ